jgi:hypothetical protein
MEKQGDRRFKDWCLAEGIKQMPKVGEPPAREVQLRGLVERVMHEKDFGGGYISEIGFLDSAKLPCKKDCLRCAFDATLAPSKAQDAGEGQAL